MTRPMEAATRGPVVNTGLVMPYSEVRVILGGSVIITLCLTGPLRQHDRFQRLVIQGILGRAARVQVQLLWVHILGIQAMVANLVPLGALFGL